MKAVSVALFLLGGSALAMPASQRLERRYDITEKQWSSLQEDCVKAQGTNAVPACGSGGNGDCEGDDVRRKAVTECMVDKSKPKLTEQSRHDECKPLAIQRVEDCVKNNTKIEGQCQRKAVESYLTCTYTGPGKPSTEQDREYTQIWADKCSKRTQEADEECKKKQDFGGKCQRQRREDDMKCLLDNKKGHSDNDFIHNVCVAAAEFGANDCFITNNTRRMTLPQCQREQWDAYPACVKKQEAWISGTKPEEDIAPKPEEDECTAEEDPTPKPEEDECTEEEDKKTKLEEDECTEEENTKTEPEENKKAKLEEDECASEKNTKTEPEENKKAKLEEDECASEENTKTEPEENKKAKLEEDECASEENTGIKAEEDKKTMLKEDTATKQDAVTELEEDKKTKAEEDESTSSAFKRWFSLRA
ncbi:Dynein heavy chain-like protein [Metarhizium anisopliae]|nr:Dynein heavy chain-like protein [Metarhizium anisopliae]